MLTRLDFRAGSCERSCPPVQRIFHKIHYFSTRIFSIGRRCPDVSVSALVCQFHPCPPRPPFSPRSDIFFNRLPVPFYRLNRHHWYRSFQTAAACVQGLQLWKFFHHHLCPIGRATFCLHVFLHPAHLRRLTFSRTVPSWPGDLPGPRLPVPLPRFFMAV